MTEKLKYVCRFHVFSRIVRFHLYLVSLGNLIVRPCTEWKINGNCGALSMGEFKNQSVLAERERQISVEQITLIHGTEKWSLHLIACTCRALS